MRKFFHCTVNADGTCDSSDHEAGDAILSLAAAHAIFETTCLDHPTGIKAVVVMFNDDTDVTIMEL